jgi:RimJ/RimL family protein N-acetyltransferase
MCESMSEEHMITIREIQKGDAERFLDLCKRIDEETQLMLREPWERDITLEEQRKQIKSILSRDNQAIFVAEIDGRLVGYLTARGGVYSRDRHRVYIVIGILQAFTSQGIGTKLFSTLERWARECKLHRLELTVMVHNDKALGLYKKMGFKIEGRKMHSFFVNGAYVDEYYMAKLSL